MNDVSTLAELNLEVLRAPERIRSLPPLELKPRLKRPDILITPAEAYPRALMTKRVCDVGFAALLLVVLSPLLIAVALAIVITDGPPILFRQNRVGKDGRIFRMYKFRTFPVDHVADVHSRPLSDCPTRLGRFLRRSSIDELPQLINVIAGDMSIIGPRPERPEFVTTLEEQVPGFYERHRMKGGITGLAQVNGLWGPTDMFERVRLDNEYIDHWSLRADTAILARTAVAVVHKVRG